jgi:hypothetical protein
MRSFTDEALRFSRLAWRVALPCLVLTSLASVSAAPTPTAAATVLYDGAKNNRPNDQGWTYLAAGGGATQNASGGATTLDTSGGKGTFAGYFAAKGGFLGSSASVPVLDRAIGYAVSFSVQVELEDHSGSDRNGDGKDDRAGFSLIVLSSDKRGIELGFWKDRIWAQEGGSGGGLFTQAEGAPFDTRSAHVLYTLTVQGDSYALSSAGAPILGGKLRDYTAFTGSPDPYKTPNLIFLGDDTSSASAKIQLAYVAAGPTVGSAPGLDRKVYLALLMRL